MWEPWAIWAAVMMAVDIVLAGAVTLHAVLWKRDSRAVIAWVGLAWLAPIVGAAAYWCLGINRIKREAARLNLHDGRRREPEAPLRPADRGRIEAATRTHPTLSGLARAGNSLSGRRILPGNRVTPLVDGDQTYPAMLRAIRQAERSVSLLSYIFDSDRAGDAFLEALAEASRRGIAVRVLVDDVGSKYSRPNMVSRLKAAGIAAAGFLPTLLPRLPRYSNLRNHRKIMVVDGRTGFTGGTNIREGHWLDLAPKDPVQCLHFELKGPVVGHLQEVFAIDWSFATGESLTGETWFPELGPEGDVWARGIEDGPDEQFEVMPELMAAALASARERVRIVTPYFLPQAALIQALRVTAIRGVAVEIFLPANNNFALVQWAATAQHWQLLEKGCRIFATADPFDHTKVMVVDGMWSLIGSTNWDPRSLRLNFEFNVECYDRILAETLDRMIDEKARSAREITMDDVNARGFAIRVRDGLARLLTPYL